MPRLERVLETALYVDDLDRARHFYSAVLGLEMLLDMETLVAFSVGGKSVLLIFLRGGSLKTQHFPDAPDSSYGKIPPHDGLGPMHICFAVDAEELPAWEKKLEGSGIPIEGRMQWAPGGQSIYFRDPDRHLLELMTPGGWPIY